MEMPAPTLPLVLMVGLLAGQFLLARRVQPAQGLILGAQAIFWFLAFALRPFYLMSVQPATLPELADARLMWTQYDGALAQVMWICVAGQATFLAGAYVFHRAVRKPQSHILADLKAPQLTWPPELIPVAVTIWSVGWLGRFGAAANVPGLDSAFRIFGTVGGALLIIVVRATSRRKTAWLVVVLVLVEELWALSFASKASLVVPLLALGLRWLLADRPGSFARRAIGLGLAALFGFLIIQPMHGVSTAETVSSTSSSDYAELQGSTVSLLERFDGLSAVTDALFMGDGEWMTLEEFAARVVVNAVPTGQIEAKSASTGQQWTREVRAESNPNQFMDVSLAAGPTAEGFALAGLLGVVLENIVLAAATMAVGSGLQGRRIIPTVFASTFAFSTILFEQGVFGLAATTNKALQLSIFAAILTLLFRSPNWHKERGSYPRSTATLSRIANSRNNADTICSNERI